MKLIKNRQGMSLVTVLMATGIGAIVLSGITTMITDIFKSQRTAQSKDAHRELTASIRHLLSDSSICSASFSGNDPSGTGFTRTQIVDAATPPNIKYKTGMSYLNNLVTITGFEVRNFTADNAVVNPKIGKVELNIMMNKLGSIIGSIQMTTTVFLQATLNAADNNLNSCYALGIVDSLWQISPTNMADIYYLNGNVGIGTTSPSSFFHIISDSLPGNQNDLKFETYENDNDWSTLAIIRARGTASAPQNLSSGDPIGGFLSIGRINGINQWTAGIEPIYKGDGTTNKSSMLFKASNADRMIIDDNGNVGIGTVNPAALFHIAGPSKGIMHVQDTANQYTDATNSLQSYVDGLDSAGREIWWMGASYTTFQNRIGLVTGYNLPLAFGTNSTERMRIDGTNGNVGIGTLNPNWPLTVGGGIEGNAFGVATSGDIIVTGGSDKKWAIFDQGMNSILSWDDNIAHMGIAGDPVASATLKVHGSIEYSGGGNISDVRYKKNIKPIQNALEKILKLEGVTFDWNRERFPKEQFKATRDIGLIAQEVEKVVPETVITDADGYKSLEYANLVALLVEGIKEQQDLINHKDQELQSRIASLESENKKLRQDSTELRVRLEKIEKSTCIQFSESR